MSSDKDPTEANHSEPQFKQTVVSNVTARDIQIGSIVQTIVNLGLPFNSQHLRFLQVAANSAYLICLIGGFIRLWQDGANAATLSLILVSCVLLSLTCLYYAGFWKPELHDKSDPSAARKQARQRTRRLAVVGTFAIPLLTSAGFFWWKSLPPTNVLLLVADFANSQNADHRDDHQVTENILRNLRRATQPYADVKVQALAQTITEQQGSEVARADGEQRKATIVIWGDYDVTPTNVQISVHFEVLKPPIYFPELGEIAKGQARTWAIQSLNRFEVQTELSKEMTYLALFTVGMVQYAREDWDRAIICFSDALAQIKERMIVLNQAAVYSYRGISYQLKGNYRQAIADYTKAINLQHNLALVYNNRGIAYSEQDNYSQAISDYNNALKLQPDLALAYTNLGLIYYKQGNYNQAILNYKKALKFQPDLALTYNNLGMVYDEQGNDIQAILNYNSALKFQPNFATAYYNRGNAYRDQHNYSQAISDYNSALKFQPGFALAYNNRGIAYNEQGNDSRAISDYTNALRLQPDLALAYSNRGNAYAKQGNDTQAISDYTNVLKIQPEFTSAYANRGLAEARQGNYNQAILDFTKALMNFNKDSKLPQPDPASVYVARGLAYAKQGKYSQTDVDYTHAAVIYYNRGNDYIAHGNYNNAISDYTRSIQFKSNFAEAYSNRGSAYAAQGNYSEAILDCNRAIQLKPDLVQAYYNKALAYSLKREIKASIESLQKAIELNPKEREFAKTDHGFDNIRQDQQFQALVGK